MWENAWRAPQGCPTPRLKSRMPQMPRLKSRMLQMPRLKSRMPQMPRLKSRMTLMHPTRLTAPMCPTRLTAPTCPDDVGGGVREGVPPC